MDYTVDKLARLAGITSRTLRYYDQIGLLRPAGTASNGYRFYGPEEVDRLQQILFYRELGMPLDEIRRLLDAPGFNREKALEEHLAALVAKRERMDILIANVRQTIRSLKGEEDMSDTEKFEGFKRRAHAENERRYGSELRRRYGDGIMDATGARFLDMSEGTYRKAEELDGEVVRLLKEAMEAGEPGGEAARLACGLHRQWLELYYPEGVYSKELHRSLGEMYETDERFRAYYDQEKEGLAAFFHHALELYCR